jgi:hypothetical protein
MRLRAALGAPPKLEARAEAMDDRTARLGLSAAADAASALLAAHNASAPAGPPSLEWPAAWRLLLVTQAVGAAADGSPTLRWVGPCEGRVVRVPIAGVNTSADGEAVRTRYSIERVMLDGRAPEDGAAGVTRARDWVHDARRRT